MEHEDVFLGDTIRQHRERLLISKAELALNARMEQLADEAEDDEP